MFFGAKKQRFTEGDLKETHSHLSHTHAWHAWKFWDQWLDLWTANCSFGIRKRGSVAQFRLGFILWLSWFDVRIRPLVCQPVQPLVLMDRAEYPWNKLIHSYDAAALHGNVSSKSQNEIWLISNNPQSRTEAGLEKSVRRILFVYSRYWC